MGHCLLGTPPGCRTHSKNRGAGTWNAIKDGSLYPETASSQIYSPNLYTSFTTHTNNKLTVMFSRLAIFATACLAIAASANPVPEKRQTLAQVITRCTVPNTVALTFDDGPWVYAYDVSKALVAANATGTFFFNGNNYQCIYDADNVKRVKYVYDHGHQVASHTWGHKDLSTLTWDQIHDEMWRVELALTKILGVVPAFMRPPYGSYNNLVRQASYVRGQKVVIWDFDSQDSVGASVSQSKALYDQIISQHPSTILPLNHETIETTVHQVLPYAISKLKQAGYRLVTLSECLGLPAYQRVTTPGVRDSTWHC
ncbi:hypothetical protein Hypma_014961 [Hypsizygus marmoreus]|uniref:NodB homology domain-containing protein n=1 Tax=Hypsizygus marmoreus TaxID=39966 RepID=A0A369K5Y2_HYPMA|nr:hypothetical protein Hypma_014961 [Hypsizygus marmoreus]